MVETTAGVEQRHIHLTAHEMQSGYDRVRYAEGLIEQLPDTHDGRNTWLINYGVGEAAEKRRQLWFDRNPGKDRANPSAYFPALTRAPHPQQPKD